MNAEDMLKLKTEKLSCHVNSELRKHGLHEAIAFSDFIAPVARQAISRLCERAGARLIADFGQEGLKFKIKANDFDVLFISNLRRLAGDGSMKTAYSILLDEFDEVSQWWRFFSAAASAAPYDFAHTRSRIERSKILRDEVVKSARALEKALLKIHQLAELDDDYYDWQNEDIDIPAVLIDRVVEESHLRDVGHEVVERRADEWSLNCFDILHEASQARCELYRKQPRPLDVVKRVLDAARTWKPQPVGLDLAALRRTRSRKLEFVRAVGWHLNNGNHTDWDADDCLFFGSSAPPLPVRKTPGLLKAIAAAVTMLIDDPSTDLSYDDVRKALESWVD